MKIKKGTLVKVDHYRKGTFSAVAMRDFDTSKEEFYPLVVAGKNAVVTGLNNEWITGEQIPCRAEFCKIARIK